MHDDAYLIEKAYQLAEDGKLEAARELLSRRRDPGRDLPPLLRRLAHGSEGLRSPGLTGLILLDVNLHLGRAPDGYVLVQQLPGLGADATLRIFENARLLANAHPEALLPVMDRVEVPGAPTQLRYRVSRPDVETLAVHGAGSFEEAARFCARLARVLQRVEAEVSAVEPGQVILLGSHLRVLSPIGAPAGRRATLIHSPRRLAFTAEPGARDARASVVVLNLAWLASRRLPPDMIARAAAGCLDDPFRVGEPRTDKARQQARLLDEIYRLGLRRLTLASVASALQAIAEARLDDAADAVRRDL